MHNLLCDKLLGRELPVLHGIRSIFYHHFPYKLYLQKWADKTFWGGVVKEYQQNDQSLLNNSSKYKEFVLLIYDSANTFTPSFLFSCRRCYRYFNNDYLCYWNNYHVHLIKLFLSNCFSQKAKIANLFPITNYTWDRTMHNQNRIYGISQSIIFKTHFRFAC